MSGGCGRSHSRRRPHSRSRAAPSRCTAAQYRCACAGHAVAHHGVVRPHIRAAACTASFKAHGLWHTCGLLHVVAYESQAAALLKLPRWLGHYNLDVHGSRASIWRWTRPAGWCRSGVSAAGRMAPPPRQDVDSLDWCMCCVPQPDQPPVHLDWHVCSCLQLKRAVAHGAALTGCCVPLLIFAPLSAPR